MGEKGNLLVGSGPTATGDGWSDAKGPGPSDAKGPDLEPLEGSARTDVAPPGLSDAKGPGLPDAKEPGLPEVPAPGATSTGGTAFGGGFGGRRDRDDEPPGTGTPGDGSLSRR